MTYEPFGELYDNRPQFIIHGRLKNCKAVMDLAATAAEKGFQVSYQESRFINDVKLNEGYDKNAPMRSHSVRTAKRFLDTHPGCS
jgi:hypothetical protein